MFDLCFVFSYNTNTMHRMAAVFGACAVCVYIVCALLATPCDAQLTQSLGWGSAGSPGKRSSSQQLLTSSDCFYNSEALDYVMLLIQVCVRVLLCGSSCTNAGSRIEDMVCMWIVDVTASNCLSVHCISCMYKLRNTHSFSHCASTAPS